MYRYFHKIKAKTRQREGSIKQFALSITHISHEYGKRMDPPTTTTTTLVTSGESTIDSADNNDSDVDEEPDCSNINVDALFYNDKLDDQDEAWVHANLMRSTNLQQAVTLKPRTSDAVLSCPCCFTIVCMDCQQHERYQTQFRAMFVMNIGVDWSLPLVYSDVSKQLVEKKESHNANIVALPTEEEIYYSVHCDACKTQVAALNITDEVYHFFACLASA